MMIDYQQHIQTNDDLVDDIKSITKGTYNENVIAGVGGFASMYALPKGYNNPVIVSATDGVGTKLDLHRSIGSLDDIGFDLVAMCVNDLLTVGARPLYFLDYYATNKFNSIEIREVVSGIVEACRVALCPLIGGETAELRGMFTDGKFDVAGFATGIVERERILGPRKVMDGDKIIAIPSSGPHSNGYTIIRDLLDNDKIPVPDGMVDNLLAPTHIYTSPIMHLLQSGVDICALANITGGGVIGNIQRIMPVGYEAHLDYFHREWPAVFKWIYTHTGYTGLEMLRTFNCGIGMVAVVPRHDVRATIDILAKYNLDAWELGQVHAKLKS